MKVFDKILESIYQSLFPRSYKNQKHDNNQAGKNKN